MNENPTPFTAEQFRQQAVELSPAVAELQRRDNKLIDPQDPFENETEFHEYGCDFGEIVPQIRIPGCRLPLKPNSRERSRIRRYQNIVGGFMLGHFVISNLAAFLLIQLFYVLLYAFDGMHGELPAAYDDMAQTYLTNSSSMIALNLLVYGTCNVAAALLGLRATRIPVSTLFRTKNFTAGHAVCYICIMLTIQTFMALAATGITDLLEGIGITPFEMDDSMLPELKSTAVSFLYSVLIAPVTEELLMRGFVLKNLSRVSQRFGILMSAFLFGIWHENLAQFLLAFCGGVFLGYIAVKHDSLIPGIICHMAVNFAAEMFNAFDTYGLDTLYDLFNVVYMVMVIAGILLLIVMFIRERLPKTVPAQTERGFRITLTSPLLLLALAAHIGMAIYYTVSEI